MRVKREVPEIIIRGARVRSSSKMPVDQVDSSVVWRAGDIKRGRDLLRSGRQVRCADATAYAAMLALGVQIAVYGADVRAENIMKGWT